MGECDVIERRLTLAESDIRTLGDKLNAFAVSQAAANTKMDSLLIALGELKEIVNCLKDKPGALWDRLISAILGALAAGLAAGVFKLL
ncbi:MAG TPA: hypothetical protein VFD23_01070 [Clostridia bacterium]|nr:hypothetical protein [Clostridia bacterium]